MKKLIVLLFTTMFAGQAWAYNTFTFKSGDLYYQGESDSDSVKVTYEKYRQAGNYSGLSTVIIPETVTYGDKIYKVTKIGDAFYKASSLTSVTIPNTIERIGYLAFTDCYNLTSITIPESVTYIGDYAFESSGLTSLTIPNSVTQIGLRAFQYCDGLTSITIPKSVTKIGDEAFAYCSNLSEINVDSENPNYCSIDGVLYDKDARTLIFCPQNKKGNIVIPNSVDSICEVAFRNCIGLVSVTIPSTVKTIGDDAFDKVKNIDYHGNAKSSQANWGAYTLNGTIDGDFIYSDAAKTNLTAYIGDGGDVIIPESVTEIGGFAFEGSVISSFVFPDSLKVVSANTFARCDHLKQIVLPLSFSKIDGEYYFRNNNCLTFKITSDNEPRTVSVYRGSTQKSVVIPDSVIYKGKTYIVSSIADCAFYLCNRIETITIPNTVKSIGEYAFERSGLKSITIPDSARLKMCAFLSCYNLEYAYIPKSVEIHHSQVFDKCEKAKIYFETDEKMSLSVKGNCCIYWNVQNANNRDYVFEFDSINQTATLVKYIGADEEVSVCNRIIKDTILYTLTTIADNAFSECNKLKYLNVGDSVVSIGQSAFYRVKNVVYSGSANGSPWGAMSVNGEIDGDFVYSDAQKTNILAYIGAGGEVVIPTTVTSIGEYAFADCANIISVIIPISVATIGECVFSGTSATIYCMVEHAAEGWNSDWSKNHKGKIVWGYKPTPITESAAREVSIYAHGNTIIVENATEEIRVYDAMGRLIVETPHCDVSTEIRVNATGLYIVKVGNVAKRVIVN